MWTQRPRTGEEGLAIVGIKAIPDGSSKAARPIPRVITIRGACGAIYQHAVLALMNRPEARPAIEVPRGPRLVVP